MTPSLLPLSPETDLPAVVRIVSLTFTPDYLDISDDEIREVEPVLVVTPAS